MRINSASIAIKAGASQGMMDFSDTDEETYAQDEDEYAQQQQAKKINILSNVSLLPHMKRTYVIKQIQIKINISNF
jgi:hypothetical protein